MVSHYKLITELLLDQAYAIKTNGNVPVRYNWLTPKHLPPFVPGVCSF